jgi:hypothetical protein
MVLEAARVSCTWARWHMQSYQTCASCRLARTIGSKPSCLIAAKTSDALPKAPERARSSARLQTSARAIRVKLRARTLDYGHIMESAAGEDPTTATTSTNSREPASWKMISECTLYSIVTLLRLRSLRAGNVACCRSASRFSRNTASHVTYSSPACKRPNAAPNVAPHSHATLPSADVTRACMIK